MPLRVIFARHGESQANIDRIFANRADIPGDLTSVGNAQARDLARSLAPFGITVIYSSPLARARQTAEIVARACNVAVTVTDALREYDVGAFEGLPYAGDDAWRWDDYLRVQEAWREGDHDARHPGGESLSEMRERFLAFANALPGSSGPSDTVLAIGHGGLYHHVLPSLFASILEEFPFMHPLGHGDVVIGRWNGQEWDCERWAGSNGTMSNHSTSA